jgi:hypothetical protein
MAAVSIVLFTDVLFAISKNLRKRGLPDNIRTEDIEALREALGRIETDVESRAKNG